jgi:hypothetical protein
MNTDPGEVNPEERRLKRVPDHYTAGSGYIEMLGYVDSDKCP